MLKESLVYFVISDLRMIGMTGLEFLNSLSDEYDNLRMILTGYSDMEAIVDALNTGKVYKYITKPWDKSSLQKTIDDALHHLQELRKLKAEAEHIREEKKAIEHIINSVENSKEDGAGQIEHTLERRCEQRRNFPRCGGQQRFLVTCLACSLTFGAKARARAVHRVTQDAGHQCMPTRLERALQGRGTQQFVDGGHGAQQRIDRFTHRPWNTGGRFSMKARIASLESSD